MMIETRTQFNSFASCFRDALFSINNSQVKISKIREILSLAINCKNHNNLLSKLPIPQEAWLTDNACNILGSLLRERHGISIDARVVIDKSLQQLNSINDVKTDIRPSKTFVPESITTFQHYARSLAWLLGESEQTGTKLLAKIYGHNNVSSLKKAIRNGRVNGPYDSEIWITGENGEMVRNPEIDEIERSNYPIEVICQYKNCSKSDLPTRYWKVRDIGLFSEPNDHRDAFDAVRNALDVMDGKDSGGHDRSVGEYAYITKDNFDEASLAFTTLGQSVYDAATEIISEENNGISDEFEKVEEKLSQLISRHPNNPWPKAIWICWAAEQLYQGDWTAYLSNRNRGGFELDAPSGYREFAIVNAEMLFPLVTETIKQFKELFGPEMSNASDHSLCTTNKDVFYWPATLYFGGCIAMNVGEHKLAKKWLTLNYKLTEGDNFGARYYLSALCLNSGIGTISRLFKKEYCDVWGWLCFAAEAFVKGDEKKARKYYLEALYESWGALEVFSRPLKERSTFKCLSNHHTPAFVQEFMHRTESFWHSNPEAISFFRAIAENEEVRMKVIEYYKNKASMFGMGLRLSMDEQSELKRITESTASTLEKAIYLA